MTYIWRKSVPVKVFRNVNVGFVRFWKVLALYQETSCFVASSDRGQCPCEVALLFSMIYYKKRTAATLKRAADVTKINAGFAPKTVNKNTQFSNSTFALMGYLGGGDSHTASLMLRLKLQRPVSECPSSCRWHGVTLQAFVSHDIRWSQIAGRFRTTSLPCSINVSFGTCDFSGVRRKFSWGGFGSGSNGVHLYLVFAVCDVTIWRHFHVSKPTFWRSLLT